MIPLRLARFFFFFCAFEVRVHCHRLCSESMTSQQHLLLINYHTQVGEARRFRQKASVGEWSLDLLVITSSFNRQS